MTGWISSVGSGPSVSMRSSATSTAWTSRHQRKRRQGENDERALVGPPDRARPALPRGGVIQSVQVRRAREPDARTLARRMARARRARDAGRRPAGRPRRRAVDADLDPARGHSARAGNPGPRRAVRAVFAETGRYQPAGLGGHDGAAVGLRGLRSVRVGGQMIDREQYTPGPASGAQVRKDGDKWTLILVRELRHSPEKVWQALTDPAQLREWAPFDADRSLGTVGTTVKLTTVGAPALHVTETTVTRADAPKVLEYNWGGFDMRWELEVFGGGTRLTLWTNIDRRFISMGAAGWHICFDVLERLLAGEPIGRIVGAEAMKFGGWQRLHAEYAKQFGVETPGWPSRPRT